MIFPLPKYSDVPIRARMSTSESTRPRARVGGSVHQPRLMPGVPARSSPSFLRDRHRVSLRHRGERSGGVDVVTRFVDPIDAAQRRRPWLAFPFAVVKKFGDD